MKWFKHMVDSGDDPDIGHIMTKFGEYGYYLFFRILELMAREFDIENPGENIFDFEWFCNRLIMKNSKPYCNGTKTQRYTHRKLVINFLETCKKLKRYDYKIQEDGFIWIKCEKLKELTDEYTKRQLAKKQKNIGTKSVPKNKNKKKNKNNIYINQDRGIKSSNINNNIDRGIYDSNSNNDLGVKPSVNSKYIDSGIKRSSCSKNYKFSERDEELAFYFEKLIKDNKPDYKFRGKQYIEKWANEVRLMRERDERDYNRIKKVIEFALNDDFWKYNILSMEKLRKQFDRLEMQMGKKKKSKTNVRPWEEIQAELEKDMIGK